MAEFVFNTREEFKRHVKLCGHEPRNYKILEEQQNTLYLTTQEPTAQEEQQPNTRELTTQEPTTPEQEQPQTQYLTIQDPTTPEEAQPPTPTEKEAHKILTNYLNNTELIEDETYKTINNVIHPQIHDEAEILTDTEDETQETSDAETTTTTKEQQTELLIIPDITKEKKENNDIINLDINDDKILCFYKELTIKELADNTTRKDQILKRIAEHNLFNDTAKLNFYKDKINKPQGEIIELSAIFCDNLILSGLTTTGRIKGKNCADCGQYTTHAREFYKARDLHTRIKPVDITNPETEDITLTRTNFYKDVILKGAEINGVYKLQNIKVATPDVPFKDVLKYHTPEHLRYLNKGGLYIHDVDYTQDVAGCIDKHKFINYLLTLPGFYVEEEEGKGDPHLKIKNNDKTTGRHCLTFLIVKNGMILRVKFYNKFIQSVESGSVRTSIGGHVADFVNNPETRLKDTIKKGLTYGILRLEISYYCKENTPDEEDIKEDFIYLKELLRKAPQNAFFYCSIEKQHEQLLSIINENIIIYDLTHKLLLFCRWWNSETKKINGIIKADITPHELRHVCAFLTFNKPFRLILLEYIKDEEPTTQTIKQEDSEEETPSETEGEDEEIEEKLKNIVKKNKEKEEQRQDKKSKAHLIQKGAKIKINVRTYEKEEQPLTHLTDNGLYPHKTEKVRNNPEDRGLKPNNNITWFIPDKKITDARAIKFKRLQNKAPLNLTSYKELNKIQKQLKEQEEDAERARILKEQTDEQIKKDEALRKQAEKLEDTLKTTGEMFNKKTAHDKLQDQTKGQHLEITAFYRINTKYGGTYIIYDRLTERTYYANTQLNNYIEAVLKDNIKVFNTRNKSNERAFYYLTHNTDLITLFYIQIKEIKRIRDNKTAILINRTNKKYLREDTKEEEQKIIERTNNTILKVEVNNKFKEPISRDTATMDSLEENKIYFIKYIKKIEQEKRNVYILHLLDETRNPIYLNKYANEPPEFKPFKSNYYIEEQFDKLKNIKDLDGQGVKAIQAGQIKLTKNKKRCRLITIRDI